MLHSNRSILKISAILPIFMALFLFMSGSKATAEEKAEQTVAVLPFEMHAPSSLAYLQEGLRDMLASRLASNGGAKIMENGKIDALLKEPGKTLPQKEAVALARQLGVNYLVTGSLTSLGGSMSLDAKVFSQEDVQPLSFYASAPQENEVIGAINSLSWDIAATVFGAKPPAHMVPAKADQAAPAEDDAMAAFKTEHPEKIYRSQGSAYGTGMGSSIIMARSSVGDFTKTQNVNFSLRSMDVGDIDGDGHLDVLMADTSNIYVYHLQDNKLVQFGTVKMPARSKIHAVSLGDTDDNGRSEIYISAADDTHPHSWAYEWNGSSLDIVLDDLPWYIRVLEIPNEGPVLVGQRGGQNSLLLAGVFKLMKSGTKVIPEDRITMPDYVNLFEFSLADITGDGAPEIIGINSANRLYVVRPNGYVLWVSDEYYGGTSRYIGEDYDLVGRTGLDLDSAHSSNVDTNKANSGKRIYIPSRIVIMDVNADGIFDVVVNKSFFTARYIENFRQVKSSEVHAMAWNGIGLGDIWQTQKINGYVPDLQLISLPGERNTAKLFAGLVLSRGWTDSLSKGESTILTYNIELAKEKAAAE